MATQRGASKCRATRKAFTGTISRAVGTSSGHRIDSSSGALTTDWTLKDRASTITSPHITWVVVAACFSRFAKRTCKRKWDARRTFAVRLGGARHFAVFRCDSARISCRVVGAFRLASTSVRNDNRVSARYSRLGFVHGLPKGEAGGGGGVAQFFRFPD